MRTTRLILACLAVLAACSKAPAPPPQPEADGPFAPGNEGIDLSHHNGRVNWEALSTAPLDFVYLKATEGRDWKDTRFQENWLEASQRGWHVGAYHFYLLCRNGAAQAENFIQSVEVREGALPRPWTWNTPTIVRLRVRKRPCWRRSGTFWRHWRPNMAPGRCSTPRRNSIGTGWQATSRITRSGCAACRARLKARC